MGIRMQRFASFLVVVFLWAVLPGCGGGGDSSSSSGGGPQSSPQVSVDPPQNLGTVTLPPGESRELFVDVGGASFMLIAEGSTFTSDIDIHSVVAPNGTTLVTENRGDDDPIGRNALKAPGGSAVAGLFYPEQNSAIQPGRYSFRIRNNDPVERDISVKAIVKHGVNLASETLNVNLVFCGVSDLSASNALSGQTQASKKFLVIFNRFKQIFRDEAHIEVAAPTLIDCSASVAKLVKIVSGKDELIKNGQSDELDQLFQVYRQDEILGLSANLPENALTIFFIPVAELPQDAIGHFDILGVSGGIPGPAMTPGTKHSGVAVATGNLTSQVDDELKDRGHAMAHEAAHFLGLFHTTEKNGQHQDPLSDTPKCPQNNDTNGDKDLRAGECLNFDGNNLMFWETASGIPQDQLTDGQRLVLHRNPLIH